MKKRRKKPAKGVKLDDSWLKNSSDIKQYKEVLLKQQGGLCAISQLPLISGVLDHTHVNGIGCDGKVRGVLHSEINMLEGRYLKQFNKLKLSEKYGLSFPDILIQMGEYLKQDNSNHPYHYAYMTEIRKKINGLTKSEIESKLRSDFKITVRGLPKNELVRLYMQSWVDNLKEK